MLPDEDAKTLTDSQFEISLGKVGPGSTVFGRYNLEKELGRGGMGVVWLALDTRVEIPVALKFLPDIVARDSEGVDELKRELRRGLSLTHPGIVRVYSFEQDPSGAAIAMEYVDGPTLSSLKLKQTAACFDCDDLAPYLEQLCAALEYAHHDAKIVHRDLKPRNLMLTSKGKLKIADFGVATSISETVSRASIRKDGSGTPPYMSPQQAFGEDPAPTDDIYSLGATLYELLTGRPPFYQGNILAQVQQRIPPPMMERREVLKILGKKPIPEHWERTIAACLAKSPEDRPASAKDVGEYLRGLRPPPAALETRDGPINPAITLESASPLPVRSHRVEAEDDEEATVRGIVRPPGPRPVPPGSQPGFMPPSRPGSRALPIMALIAVVGVGAGLWWWQGQEDAREREMILAAKGATPEPTVIAATPLPAVTSMVDTQAAERRAAEERARAEADAAERLALKDDFDQILQGKLPRQDGAWINGMQMRFVPVPGIKALVAAHETRMGDYKTFASETKRPWVPTEFEQGDDHPVVNLTWDDAQAFSQWLTQRERSAGRLGTRQVYRLPTDVEWSAAAGLTNEEGETPRDRDGLIPGKYEWDSSGVPPKDAGNFAGEGETALQDTELIGYNDGYTHTAPTGKFTPNAFGVHDLPGNVAEWVEDWYDASKTERTVRGAAWVYLAKHDLLTSFRWHQKPSEVADYIGFRLVLDVGRMPDNLPTPEETAPRAEPARPQ